VWNLIVLLLLLGDFGLCLSGLEFVVGERNNEFDIGVARKETGSLALACKNEK
jgi:hypothetical protein